MQFIPAHGAAGIGGKRADGALPQAMVQMSRYYQQQFQQRLQMLGRLLEPCFILVLGIAVLVLAGSLFLPLIQSYQYLL